MPVNFDVPELEQWFAEESAKVFMDFLMQIAGILDDCDEQVAAVENAGWGESVADKMIRDIRAAGYEQIEAAVVTII